MEVLVNEEDTEWTNKHHQTFGAVDGRNPKQPPGMYKNLYIMGQTSLSTGLPDLLNHQQTVGIFFLLLHFFQSPSSKPRDDSMSKHVPKSSKLRSSKKGFDFGIAIMVLGAFRSMNKGSPQKKSHRVFAKAICPENDLNILDFKKRSRLKRLAVM